MKPTPGKLRADLEGLRGLRVSSPGRAYEHVHVSASNPAELPEVVERLKAKGWAAHLAPGPVVVVRPAQLTLPLGREAVGERRVLPWRERRRL